jgi:glucans biosynthesis protein
VPATSACWVRVRYTVFPRGLAIDTALPSGEEFPRFREFWIERPKATDKRLTIYALLDSPRATGAYRFVIMPGRDTVVDVQSKVYLRDKVGKLGVAPLTSMFLFGSNQPSPALNYRPALHDSNGLSILAGNGEWIWRPLNNPKHLAVSSYAMENPQGSACCSAAVSSRALRTSTIVMTCARAPGSPERGLGQRENRTG